MSVDISERGLIGLAVGRTMQVLCNAFTQPIDVTYLTHAIRTPNAALSSGAGAAASHRALLSNVAVTDVKFRPLEDVLCGGHSHGISTIIVPGAGEANFDSFENNPFMNPRQRREAEVQTLLSKLSHEMIGLGACSCSINCIIANTHFLCARRRLVRGLGGEGPRETARGPEVAVRRRQQGRARQEGELTALRHLFARLI